MASASSGALSQPLSNRKSAKLGNIMRHRRMMFPNNILCCTKAAGVLLRPFLVKLGVITETEMDILYQQTLIELRALDFCGIWHYMTAWGNKPEKS
ncbi:MAG: hypothetical protein JO215_03435 [Ktedonobacteraceae bacterium]|nr:hypothetical protein [Ktedonobacteraceae bacterium]